MDRAITLRRNFNNGVPSVVTNPGCGAENNPCVYNSLPIKVVNMSLGGSTLIAGQDLEDQLTLQMLQVGITVIVSSGNAGPGALTIGSPGTSNAVVTAAAASTAAHERVLRDLQFGLGIGDLLAGPSPACRPRPSARAVRRPTAVSTSAFRPPVSPTSPREPPAAFHLVSGTSFAAPTIAGAAALLRQKFPSASATQIRNALIEGANPNAFADNSGKIDRGNGLLDIPGASAKLAGGHVSNQLPVGLGLPSVALNLLPLGIFPVSFVGNTSTTHLTNLKPGEVRQLYVPTLDNTDDLTVTVKNVTPTLAPASQNQLFGDDIFLTVDDAFTSFAQTVASGFVVADTDFDVPLPQTGLVRVAVQGDTTNAGTISADVVVTRHNASLTNPTKIGQIQQGGDTAVRVQVAPGTAQLSFQLSWLLNWGAYPTNDIDLVLVDPAGNTNFDAATLNSPERAVIANPTPGVWTAHVQGFAINSLFNIFNSDIYTLRASADGHRLAPLP